jgi:hypothetical protein
MPFALIVGCLSCFLCLINRDVRFDGALMLLVHPERTLPRDPEFSFLRLTAIKSIKREDNLSYLTP